MNDEKFHGSASCGYGMYAVGTGGLAGRSRVSAALPDARFLACFWRPDQDGGNMEELRKKIGADLIATSLKDAAQICCDEMKASLSARGRSVIQDKSAVAG